MSVLRYGFNTNLRAYLGSQYTSEEPVAASPHDLGEVEI